MDDASLRAARGPTSLLALEAVAIDTEATTLDAGNARIVQIAGVHVHDGEVNKGALFESLVNPGSSITESATAIHGITDAMVAGAPAFGEIATRLEEFVGERIIIGHGLAYDFAVLQREYELAGRALPRWRWLDTVDLARIAGPVLADYSLDRIGEWLGVPVHGRHTAASDAIATAEAFLCLVPLLRSKNIRTLAEAEAGARMLAERQPGSATHRPVGEDDRFPRLDSFPYRHRVRDVMSAPAVFSDPNATVLQAAQTMVERGVSSVFVRRSSGEIGIVTERDILRAMAADGGASASRRIDSVAKGPLQTVGEDAFLYRAIGRLQRLGFRHLGVTDAEGRLVGAVTTHNLLRDRTTAAVILGDEIESATTSVELASAWAKLVTVVRSLSAEEVDPRTISAIISAEICSMTKQATQLAEQQLLREGGGSPPAPYAVLVLGSAGRGESQLAADQDNAIVYDAARADGAEDGYFERLGGLINETLDVAGIPLCKGGVMAGNRTWRKSLADWRTTIDDWIRRQRPQDLLNIDIFFDGISVHGDASLGDEIWRHAYENGSRARDFQNLLIEATRRSENAFTMFGGLKLDSGNRMDLKRLGLMPIFTAARVLSIRHKLLARSTVDRLKQAQAAGVAAAAIVERILDAQGMLLGTVIAQQLRDAQAGIPLSTRVELRRPDARLRSRLKQALRAADEAVGLVAEGRI